MNLYAVGILMALRNERYRSELLFGERTGHVMTGSFECFGCRKLRSRSRATPSVHWETLPHGPCKV